MDIVFIDTNVMAHAVFLTDIKKDDFSEKIWKRYKKLLPSYYFLNNLKESKFDMYSFCTSYLAFSEIFHAIIDESICKLMFLDGIPFSAWRIAKPKMKVEEKDINKINYELFEFWNKTTTLDYREKNKIVMLDDWYDYDIISHLTLRKKCEVHDAILLSTAIYNKAKYFVTKDKDLRDKKIEEIEIIPPEFLNEKLK